ncbi:hypothetical protein BGX38DRAFT_1276223 [Terfezia claveryi]|nr:hypothetical protein BGX38DRAFT_1276223 [Terfezia claveryi]
MTTNDDPDEDVFVYELLRFLVAHDFLTYDLSIELWILISTIITEERLETLIKLIVADWRQNGITKMSEFETLKGMTLDEVVAMVREKRELGLKLATKAGAVGKYDSSRENGAMPTA